MVRKDSIVKVSIYHSFSDVTDIRVLLDRNNLPEFKLDFDNNIVLGMPKLMHLEVEVEVDGELLVNLYLDLSRDNS